MTRSSLSYPLFLSLIGGLFIVNGYSQSSEHSPKVPNSEYLSLDLKEASFADVVKYLGAMYRLNFVADSFADDPRLRRVQIQQVPRDIALAQLAELFDRTILLSDGIVVFRHKKWFMRSKQETFSAENYEVRWQEEGTISLKVLEHVEGQTSESSPRVSLIIDRAPLKKVAAVISAQTGWVLRLQDTFETRRVTAHLESIRTSHFLEALTVLLNARQEIVLNQSETQKKQEAELEAQALDTRRPVDKLSDALKAELMRIMTPEQQKQIGEGKSLLFSISELPDSIRSKAIEYVFACSEELPKLLPNGPVIEIDLKQAQQFKLEIPPPPSLRVGIRGIDINGTEIWF
jgi:hypothetical protein